jgi:type 1 glutamine amidotransferase
MKKMLFLGGGTWHDFEPSARAVIKAFSPLIRCEYTEDPARLKAGSLKGYDALAMFTCFAKEDDGLKDKGRAELPADIRRSVEDFVSNGGPFLPLHSTMCSYTDWEGLSQILGIRWVWGTSFHGPHETYTLRLNKSHPLASEFEEFEIHDELYRKLKPVRPVDILMTAWAEGSQQPHAWTSSYGKGRIFFWGPGHNAATLEKPHVQKALAGGLKWALGG